MPRVPTSDGPQLQVQQLNPVRQQNVDVSSGLQVLARGVGQLGDAVDQIALREDQTQADQVDAQITSSWLKWDAENRNKFRGQNADGYEGAAQAWWKASAESFGKDLSPRARALASRSLVRKQGTALANVTQFIGAEKERFAVESYTAKQASTVQFGVTTGDTAGAAEQIRQSVAAFGADRGWTTEQVQAEQIKNLSTLHAAQIEKLLDTNPQAAKDYYAKARDANEIPATAQSRIEKAITTAVTQDTASRNASAWAALPYPERRAKAAEIDDPETRKATEQQIDMDETRIQRSKTAQAKDLGGRAELAYQKTGRVPAAVMTQLEEIDPGAAADLRKYMRADQKARATEASGGSVKTDQRSYFEARDRVLAGENFNVLGYADKVSRSDLEELKKLQEARSKPGEVKRVFTEEQTISAFKPAGLGDNSEKWAGLRRQMQEELITAREAKGRDLTDREMRETLKPLFVEGVIEKKLWPDETKPRWQMTPQEQAKAKFPDKPADKPADNQAAPVHVKTPAQARALPKGTRFIDPNGIERIR